MGSFFIYTGFFAHSTSNSKKGDTVNGTQDVSIRFDLPYSEAKQLWTNVFETTYLAHAFENAGGNIMRAARTIGLDRKHARHLLRKYKIANSTLKTSKEEDFMPDTPTLIAGAQQPTPKKHLFVTLRRQFENGVNFKRGLIAYLHFNGERTTREGVRQIGPILGGLRTYGSRCQYRHWNQLQVLLKNIGILVATTNYCIYKWNDALVPLLYKQALEKKHAGISVEEILTICFPNDANTIDSFL